MYRACVVLAGLAFGLTGCMDSKSVKEQNRGQIGEDSTDAEAFATVGMKTLPDNMGAIPVSGVGLVYRLQPGMGSSAPAGTYRTMLERSLKKQGFSHLKELLDDPNRTTSLVLVSALIPPGARKGEAIDVQISVPEESRTTSLKGGVLLACELQDYDTTGNLRSVAKEKRESGPSGSLVLGSVWAKAEGPVVAGAMVDSKDAEKATIEDLEPPSLRAGRIWGGGHITQKRPYYFMMKPGDQSIRMAANVAERLNASFQGNTDSTLRIADAKTREMVTVSVPYAYRNNHHRFLLVARQVPINPVHGDSFYRKRLEEELHDPAKALTAALKLEAIGINVKQPLRVALNNTSPWVRFAAAESLAYLGYTDGAAELAKLAEAHPSLRASCLKALAASDDAAFTDRLIELMCGADPTLRYGAFMAMRLASENNPAINGKPLGNSPWLHHVAPGSPGLIHLSALRRSEVVIFGDGVRFNGPFNLPVGSEYTVSMSTASPDVKVTKVISIAGGTDVKEVKCAPEVTAVLAAIAKMGGGYAEAVELIRRADAAQKLTSALVVDAIPREFSIQKLASYSRRDPSLTKADVEVARVGTRGTDLEAAGLDLAAEPDAEAKPEAPTRPPLSRQPGRLFGPKQAPPEPTVGEPLTPVNAEEEAAPPEPAPVAQELSRNHGRLFPRK